MTVAFRAVGAAVGGTTTVSPALPAGTVANDILVMVTECANTETVTVSGWTEVANSGQVDAGSGLSKLQIFWRRATGTDPTATAGTTNHINAQIAGFSGVRKNGNPWEATAGSGADAGTTTATMPAVTTTVSGCMIVAVGGIGRDVSSTTQWSAFTNANLTSLTERMDDSISTGTGGGFSMATGLFNSTGSCGSTTATTTTSFVHTSWTGALQPEVSPTVLQNITDGYTFAESRPGLLFTGTDLNTDDISFEIVLETVPNDNYDEVNLSSSFGLNNNGSASTRVGQSFHGWSGQLCIVGVYGFKTGSPTGNLVATLRNHTGTYGTSSLAGSTVYSTSDSIAASSIPTTPGWIYFIFSTPYTMSSGTDYCFQVEQSSGNDTSNYISIYNDQTSPTHSGNEFDDGFTYIGHPGNDLIFKLWDSVSAITMTKLSNVDSGFINVYNGADVDPFDSGAQIRYTPQIFLINGTYRWSVRGIDSSGSNLYGTSSGYRTFIVSTPNSKFLAFM